jgi:hypothetical protein
MQIRTSKPLGLLLPLAVLIHGPSFVCESEFLLRCFASAIGVIDVNFIQKCRSRARAETLPSPSWRPFGYGWLCVMSHTLELR